MSNSHFKVDSALRWNVGVALFLLVLCPLALWQFHFREDLSTSNKRLTIAERINEFYRAFDRQSFDANQQFAKEVIQYDSLLNITPEEINSSIQKDRKNNQYPRTEILPKSIQLDVTSEGDSVAVVSSRCTRYRKSVVKYVTFEQVQRLVFDKNNKVISLETLEKSSESFSYTMPK